MQSMRLAAGSSTRFAVVLDEGDEIAESLETFAREESLDGASFTAIGAVSEAMLGFFDPGIRDYVGIPVGEQAEVLSLVGDITRADPDAASTDGSARTVHGHMVLGLSDGRTVGGHLLSGRVRPTLEIIVTETPAEMRRTYRADVGLALIDPGASREG